MPVQQAYVALQHKWGSQYHQVYSLTCIFTPAAEDRSARQMHRAISAVLRPYHSLLCLDSCGEHLIHAQRATQADYQLVHSATFNITACACFWVLHAADDVKTANLGLPVTSMQEILGKEAPLGAAVRSKSTVIWETGPNLLAERGLLAQGPKAPTAVHLLDGERCLIEAPVLQPVCLKGRAGLLHVRQLLLGIVIPVLHLAQLALHIMLKFEISLA